MIEYVLELYDSDASWGPNVKQAEVWDARNVGWSRYDRLSGKAFATLPQTSSYLSKLVGLETHVKVTRVAPSGNVEVFNGLLIDYDSTGDDVVLDVVDYLGLLSASRCGYKTMYGGTLVSYAMHLEWEKARTATGSRVAFVATGACDDYMGRGSNQLFTNSTFGVMDQMRLAFFYDMSELGRANTTYQSTFEITRTAPFYFNIWRDQGSASGVPLILNGNVSDYRYLPGWSYYRNDVATIGQTTGGGATELTAVDSAAISDKGLWQDAGVNKNLLGFSGANAYQDQQAAGTARMLQRGLQGGPAIAVQLVRGAIDPYTGWDINDTMQVEIVNGIDNLTGRMRVLGVRCVYDEAGEGMSLIVGPVLT